jgi:cell division protease FtsH
MNGSQADHRTDHAAGHDGDAVLRQFARRAIGCSGADIERLVREARQRARREKRPLARADLDHLLAASRPAMSPQKRRRVAVHEAGHALARILLGVGEITMITIDTLDGNAFTESISSDDSIETPEACEAWLVAVMAGRAAEQVVYGSALAGSGGTPRSDLAQATRLATVMEVSLGFGRHYPLLYRDPDHWQTLLGQDVHLARRVHARLADAERNGRRLIRKNRDRLAMIADELVARGTLEGAALRSLVRRVIGQDADDAKAAPRA